MRVTCRAPRRALAPTDIRALHGGNTGPALVESTVSALAESALQKLVIHAFETNLDQILIAS
jgi:hypothetical protein